MKKLLIAILLIGVLLGGATGALYYFGIGPFEAESVEEPATDTVKPVVDEGPIPQFIPMTPLAIPLFKRDKVIGNVQIMIKVETPTKESAAVLRKELPRLNDAFLLDLYEFIPRHLRGRKQIDLGIIKDRLMIIAHRTLEPPLVKDILVQGVQENAF